MQELRKKLKEIKPDNVEMFDALILEPRNLQIAMDFAQGSEARAVESDPQALLEKLTVELTAKAEAEHARDRQSLIARHKAALADNLAKQEELARQLADLESARQKKLNLDCNRVIAKFHSYWRWMTTSSAIIKYVLAFVLLISVFLTSSILLGRLDSAGKYGWTFILSAIVAISAAITIVADPRQLMESGLRSIWQNLFIKRIRNSNLVEASAQQSWLRLSEQILRVDKWSVRRG